MSSAEESAAFESESARNSLPLSAVIPDESLRAMIDETPDEVCSLIVEAALPSRMFGFSKKNPKRLVSTADKKSLQTRESILDSVAAQLIAIAGPDQTNVLKSAGAIAMNIPARRMKDVSQVPNVKVIRANRQLRKQAKPHL